MSVTGISSSVQLPANHVTGEGPPNTMPPNAQAISEHAPATPSPDVIAQAEGPPNTMPPQVASESTPNTMPSQNTQEPSVSDALIRSRFTPTAV